jgi:hypothetical protein
MNGSVAGQRGLILAAGVLFAVAIAAGQTNIDPDHKSSWGENVGFENWRDANVGGDGVRVRATYLEGFIWAENVGWINVGDGIPGDGIHYANNPGDSSTFGVNIDPATGDLFGMAWGENIGWVNFDTRVALGPQNQQARFDFAAGRFFGYAWAENVGWINLGAPTLFVAYVAPNCNNPFADADGDGDVDQADYAMFQQCFGGAGRPAADGCECFDRPTPGFPHGDNDVDGDDAADWEQCASGPAIPANPACGG